MIPIVILLISIFSVFSVSQNTKKKTLGSYEARVFYLIECFSLAQQNPRDDLIITTTRRLIIIELILCILSLLLVYFASTVCCIFYDQPRLLIKLVP